MENCTRVSLKLKIEGNRRKIPIDFAAESGDKLGQVRQKIGETINSERTYNIVWKGTIEIFQNIVGSKIAF